MTEDFTNSTVFKAIIIAILVLTLFCTLASLCHITDMRKMENELELQTAKIHCIGAMVREPHCVFHDRLIAISELRAAHGYDWNYHPSWEEVTEYLRANDQHYANGEMTLPNWITG